MYHREAMRRLEARKTPSERLQERLLNLGLKPRLTRAEQAEYDELSAARDAYLRLTGATARAFENWLGPAYPE